MVFGKAKSDDPVVLMQQGHYRDAIKLLQRKLRRNPGDLPSKIKLAEAYEGDGKLAKAAELYVAEAEACLAGGQRSKALALFKKAARLQPENESVRHHILQLESPSDRNDSEAFSFDIGGDAEPAGALESEPSEESREVVTEEGTEEVDEVGAPPQEPNPIEPVFGEPLSPEAEAGTSVSNLSSRMAPPPEMETADSLKAPLADPSPDEGAVEAAALESVDISEKFSSGDFEMVEESSSRRTVSGQRAQNETQPPTVQDLSAAQDLPVGAAQIPPPEDFLSLIKAFFPDLEEHQAKVLNALARPISLEAGDVLVREREEGDSLFIITRGRLEARGRFESGEYNLALLSAGDIIGEVAFLKRVPRTATVTAAERSLVLELPGEETRKQLEPHPELLAHLETILQERVEKTLYLLKSYEKDHHGDKTH
jgi:hypothetical protein